MRRRHSNRIPQPEERKFRNIHKIISLLLEHGADINATDNDNNTPLHGMAFLNAHEIVALLIEHGADVNAKDNKGNTGVMQG